MGVFYQALFSVQVDNFDVVPSAAGIQGNELWLSVLNHISNEQAAGVSYDNLFAKAAPGLLVDRAGNPLAGFDDRAATNNSQFTPDKPAEGEVPAIPVILNLTNANITVTEGGHGHLYRSHGAPAAGRRQYKGGDYHRPR